MLIKCCLRLAGTNVRLFSSSAYLQAVDKGSLSKLRKKTGFPFINCKKALEKFDNDIKQAEVWLKEQAQKEGWAKATKLQDRPMSQGLIGVMIEQQKAAMVEVNCETDFVARNPKFQKLVSKTAAMCLQQSDSADSSKVFYDKSTIKDLEIDGQKIGDLVALEVGNIGENMAVRRAAVLSAKDGSHIGSYVHTTGPQIVQDHKCKMGRFGAMVSFSLTKDDQVGAPELGRQLSQHVVGMNPATIGTNEDDSRKDDDKQMLHQEFLLDPTLTVLEFLQQNSAEVHDFVRFECGEDLGEDNN